MPADKNRKTPGVYVTEPSSFPPSIVGVQTAVPAFVGYTDKAEVAGEPVLQRPVQVGSLADFEEIFGGRFVPELELEAISATEAAAGHYDFKVQDGSNSAWKYYDLTLPDGARRFNLYDGMRLFYDNGGGDCWVVSVGLYAEGPVALDPLLAGLKAVGEQTGPTMLVVPEAILLPADTGEVIASADYRKVVQAMVEQASELQDRVAVLDVYGSEMAGRTVDVGGTPTQITLDEVIEQFHDDLAALEPEQLSYGMAYFPFVEATVLPLGSVDYTWVDRANDYSTLMAILTLERENLYGGGPTPADGRARAVQDAIDAMATTTDPEDVQALDRNLSASLPLLGNIKSILLDKSRVLPPSPAMAGVYTQLDGSRGVWQAPANVSLASVAAPTFKLDDEQQGDLNVPVDGKAVDALREFSGRGTVVWGARTLDGNSNDYRYIQVRRTLIYIEQSIRRALEPFAFAANDGNTWAQVISMVSGFLHAIWEQGGLMGATASEAFSVECGLGSTMTAEDVLEGYMIVQVTLQMIRPAEFIELTFKQKMDN